MAYTPTEWKKGDVVTSDKLNKLEQGVASGGGVLVVNENTDTGALDKTWQEINDAPLAVVVTEYGGAKNMGFVIQTANVEDVGYAVVMVMPQAAQDGVAWTGIPYLATAADGYPEQSMS